MQNYVLCLKDLCGKTALRGDGFFSFDRIAKCGGRIMKKVGKRLVYFHDLELRFSLSFDNRN